MMIKHHIKVAIRNIKKQGMYSLLNVLGLAIGVTMSLFVLLLVKYELNFDKSFSDSQRIYRYTTKGVLGNNFINSASSPMPLASFVSKYDEVEEVVFMIPGANNVVSNGAKQFNEDEFRFVPFNFFQVFDVPFIEGDSKTALVEPESIVLTKKVARKYFGDVKAMGQTINRAGIDYVITGVCEDLPSSTHFNFSFAASISTIDNILLKKGDSAYVKNWKSDWLYLNGYTYVKLKEGYDSGKYEVKLNQDKELALQEQVAGMLNSEIDIDEIELNFYLQAVTSIHLSSHLSGELSVNSKPIYVKLFVFIAVFILLTTCVNFINLTTAKSHRRFKEVGVRQLIGATRRQLGFQFLTEAVVYSFGATFFGLVLLELLLPFLNSYFHLNLEFSLLSGWLDFFWVLLLVVVVGILSGSFPAMFYAGLKPEQVMVGNYQVKKIGITIRGLLVCCQVAVSMFLLIVVAGMWWQIQFVKNNDPGFAYDKVMVIERGNAVGEKFDLFKEEVNQLSGVELVSACSSMPGDDYFHGTFKIESGGGEKVVMVPLNYVEEDYLELLNVTLKNGRFFDKKNDSLGIIINSTAVEEYALKKPLNQTIEVLGNKNWALSVVGVVKDFHFESYYADIRPLALVLLGKKMRFDYILVKLDDDYTNSDLGKIEDVWSKHSDGDPFVWSMMKSRLDKLYDEDKRIVKIISVFAILALFMTIMGIVALATFMMEYKARPIGIKKLLGAPRQSVILQVLSAFSVYVFVGVVIAFIPAFIALKAWIASYSYYSFIHLYYFPLLALPVLGLAFISVFYQTYQMASNGPIES
ncbi:ABC transporter permease [Carboxylicivirga sp. N1Y90]|uniref:ABC transporter permease n=1 Tax=Carboxylicivirga fragile TaxID=3417571 RepID=UPI003D33E32B|nr:ABC transporter permease [Marinilabiliaceae bacterium N1Y90]